MRTLLRQAKQCCPGLLFNQLRRLSYKFYMPRREELPLTGILPLSENIVSRMSLTLCL